MPITQLTVIGAGLIGGSICLAARRAGFAEHIVAIDRTPDRTRHDVADTWIDADDRSLVEQALDHSALTVLCTPVGTIIDALPFILSRGAGVVTDCGSTKVRVAAAAADLPSGPRFVPGHPMAGRPEGGLRHADPELFAGRTWLLCPRHAGAAATALVRALVIACRATPIELDPQEHDHSVAYTSHLPQVVASLLSVLASEAQALAAAGPGFASATRVAGGAAEMWGDIFETNGAELGPALRELGARLDGFAQDLERGDAASLLATLDRARQLRSG
jgi:prephenate dehydrogenase